MHKIISLCKNFIYFFRQSEYEHYKQKKCRKLKQTDFTIISSGCSGTIMYCDLGLPYLSPTINLAIEMKDFIKMVENLKWYMTGEIIELKKDTAYPVGPLRDIELHFMHYRSFEEAVSKWEERKKRINWDKIFIVGNAWNGDLEVLKRFDHLPYKNKVVFTPINHPEIPSALFIKGFEKTGKIGILTDYKNQLFKRRYLDAFDYVSFLNNGQ